MTHRMKTILGGAMATAVMTVSLGLATAPAYAASDAGRAKPSAAARAQVQKKCRAQVNGAFNSAIKAVDAAKTPLAIRAALLRYMERNNDAYVQLAALYPRLSTSVVLAHRFYTFLVETYSRPIALVLTVVPQFYIIRFELQKLLPLMRGAGISACNTI